MLKVQFWFSDRFRDYPPNLWWCNAFFNAKIGYFRSLNRRCINWPWLRNSVMNRWHLLYETQWPVKRFMIFGYIFGFYIHFENVRFTSCYF